MNLLFYVSKQKLLQKVLIQETGVGMIPTVKCQESGHEIFVCIKAHVKVNVWTFTENFSGIFDVLSYYIEN